MNVIRFSKLVLCALCPVLWLATPAQALLLTFDDGIAGGQIGTYYSGVTFSANAIFNSNPFAPPPSLGIGNGTGRWPYDFLPSNPVTITFTVPQAYVTIDALDVYVRGARIDAYDSSGSLIDWDEAYGPPEGIVRELAVLSGGPTPAITSIQIYQPALPDFTDGMIWDNLFFDTVVPTGVAVPDTGSTWGLLALGCLCLGTLRRTLAARVAK